MLSYVAPTYVNLMSKYQHICGVSFLPLSHHFSCAVSCSSRAVFPFTLYLPLLTFQNNPPVLPPPPPPPPLCSAAIWPRTHLFVTVTWSGWLTTCAPTPSRPVVPAAPALAALQTNASDRSRARNSVARVGLWLSLPFSKCFLIYLPSSLRGFGVFIVFSCFFILTLSLSLSAGSGFYLCVVLSSSYHI